MKTKNVIMPVLAFVVAIGMAFATTPINGFAPEVWRGTGENDCHESDCMLDGILECNGATLYFDEPTCTSIPIPAYQKVN